MDSQILSLYAKSMTTRKIVDMFKEMHDADVSPTLISKVTDAVKEQLAEWHNRQQDELYPIVYVDYIVVKVRQNGSVINKAVFPTPGINTESWQAHWENLNTLFGYPPDIRKAIYTTNAIESLNSVIRAAIKKRKVFPRNGWYGRLFT